eukprot:scaffold292776_cov17-Tisochrysis_lutea.AAC.1
MEATHEEHVPVKKCQEKILVMPVFCPNRLLSKLTNRNQSQSSFLSPGQAVSFNSCCDSLLSAPACYRNGHVVDSAKRICVR